eukprot:3084158-Amphidinium_carterae.1
MSKEAFFKTSLCPKGPTVRDCTLALGAVGLEPVAKVQFRQIVSHMHRACSSQMAHSNSRLRLPMSKPFCLTTL